MKKFLQNLIFQNKTSWGLGVLFLLLVWMPEQSLAQTKDYAVTVYEYKNVDNQGNAVDGNESTKATLRAHPGAVGLGRKSGSLGLEFTNVIPSKKPVYVKVNAGDQDILKRLLGGSVGNLLVGSLNNLLLGSHSFEIGAYSGGVKLFSSRSTSGFQDSRIKFIQDKDGDYMFALQSVESFNRLKIENSSNALLGLTGDKKFDVYDAFYYTGNETNCGRPIGTSFDASGLGLTLLGNLANEDTFYKAIDGDESSFSTLKQGSLLSVDVAGSLSQYFYFPTISSETSTINIKLSLSSGGLVNTDLLGAAEVVLYNGDEEVYRRSLHSSLLNNTDALGLLQSGNPITMTFAPGREFDRAAVSLSSPVGLSVAGSALYIYDVQRYDDAAGCANPEIAALPAATSTPFETPSCASRLIDFDNVDFAQRAVDGNNESYATLYADSGNLLVSGPTAGFIEMDLGQTVPANKTTYVRINYDEDVLDRLVGGSLGKLVGDLANNLLLGNQYFEVEAKNGDTAVLTGTSSNAFEGTSNGATTMVQDNIGRYYIAITPNVTYNRIRITNNVVALLSTGKKAALDVYNACFELGTDSCLPANFTSYRGGGIGLNVGNISSVGVTNAYRAISENSSDYSEINLGIAGVLSHVYQTVYFSQPSKTGDKVKIRLAIEPSSPLSLDVLGRYQIKFFNGNVQVGGNETLQAGLLNNIDVLTLFNSGGIVELEYEPSGTFDRVDVGAESIASVNVAAEPLRVYSVERYGDTCPLTIGESPFMDPSCATELLAADNADNVQNLFDGNFDSYATLKSGAGVLFGINDLEGFVELGYNQPVSSGTTSYIRIDFDPGILESLVSGSLGNLVTGLLDNVLLGKHFFKVEVKDVNGNVIDEAASSGASASDAIRVVQDKEGRYYIAVTPTADYKSVRITDATNALLGVGSQPNTMNIYGMCHETSIADCMAPFATSYEFNGLNLSVNDLSGAGVTNAEFALNANSTQGSLISNGTLGIGTSTKQWIYFNKVSDVDEVVNISFKTQAGGIDLDLLGSLEIKAYLGNTEVTTLDWQNGLVNGVNVLNLLSNGEVVNLPFMPGAPFDRITVGIKTIVGVSVFPPVELLAVEPCTTINTKLLSNPNITNKLRN
ncbi:hypothetical protein HCG49_17805 [Arenibacter sp. 6A1]|uniref:hypothetical protein n=1 Tax=Arenibacter sp. 6A1 TaxID=2720391 RepID=UPI0014461E17|nr:hypothetical protein [Arenibacter sp. 6A1]NKI28409.1 hypothetical protein [Arenibacter sp. 6A1]